MKKAKEYAQEIIETDEANINKVLSDVVSSLGEEMHKILQERKPASRSGCVTVTEEIIIKWKAICNKVNKHFGVPLMKLDGYEKWMELKAPWVHTQLIEDRNDRKAINRMFKRL